MKSTITTSVSVTEKVAPGMSDDSDCEKVPEMPPTHASKSKPFWQIRATSRQTPTSSQSSSSENKKYGCTSCLNIFDSFRILQEMTVAKTKTTLQSNKKWNIRKSANKGWLITTKGFDQEARLAQKRSAAIDRQIEEDSHRQKREAQVMVTSFDRKCEGTSLLLEALSSYCTGTKPPLLPQGQRGISDDDAALAGKVRNAVLKELCRIFEEIGQTCGIDVDSDVHTRDLDRVAVLKTCLDLYHKVEGRIHEKKSLQGDRLDDEIASKVKTLWENEIWLEECYRRKARRSKVFDEILLELLARASRSDYVPVASDIARLTRLPTNFPHVISKSYEIDCTLINIINQDNIPCCAPIRKRLCNYLNDLTSALVLVDLASYTYTNPTGDGNPVQNGLHDTLIAFESYTKYCNRVLGNNTKIMVLFWNCQAFKEKLKSGKYPLEKYFPDFKHGEHTYLKFMAQKFAAAWDKGGGMSQIEIRCGEPSDADVIKWIGSTVKTTLLDQGLCELGLFKPRTGGDKLWYGRR